MNVFDLDLLRTFVHVVDCGGFTRAGERVHRTQSTISQQIKRLEDQVERPLLVRQGRNIELTEAGETLIGYARRMLALQDEAQSMLVRREAAEIVRLGIPEDFAGRHLPRALAQYARAHPGVRLDVRCDLSCNLARDFATGELDVALVKGESEAAGAFGTWPESLHWAGPARDAVPAGPPLPLAVFPQGCVFRRLALERLDRAAIPWRIAYSSPSLQGVQAAVASGIAVAPLGGLALNADLAWLDEAEHGLPPLPPVWFSLLVQPGRSPARTRLAEAIAETVETAQRRLDAAV